MRTLELKIKPENQLVIDVLNCNHNQANTTRLYKLLIPVINSIIYKMAYHLREKNSELAHDLFVKTYYNLHKFNTEKNLFPWVKTIVKNTLIDLYRKDKTYKIQSIDLMQENPNFKEIHVDLIDNNSPENIIIKNEEKIKLFEMLGHLSEFNRTLIIGFYLDDKSLKELSIESNCTENAISTRLFRIRRELSLKFRKI